MFAAVIVYFQTTGLTILDNGGPLLQSDILCYSLNIVHRKPPEFKKCEKLRKFFNCTQLSQKSEALRRTLVVYHLPICNGKTRVQVFYNTVLRNFPLFCPKCKLTHIVDVEKLEIIIKNSEKQTF